MDEDLIPDTYVCAFCGNMVESQTDTQHHPECPWQTNIWSVSSLGVMQCYYCERKMSAVEKFRLIPEYDYGETDEELEASIGRPKQLQTQPACLDCCRLRVVVSGEVGESPGQAM